MTNSADPDQKKPTNLDLHCLLRQGILCLAREGLSTQIFQIFKVYKDPVKSSHPNILGPVVQNLMELLAKVTLKFLSLNMAIASDIFC